MKYIKITLLLAIAASSTLHGFSPGDASSAGPSENQETEQPQEPTVKKRFVCLYPRCGYDTNKKWCFDNHAKTHSVEKPFQCPFCKKPFRRKDYARSHVKVLHPGEKIHHIETEPNSAPSNKTDAEDTYTATPPQMPAQRDYRSQSPDSINRRERSPQPIRDQDDPSYFPVMSPEELRWEQLLDAYLAGLAPIVSEPQPSAEVKRPESPNNLQNSSNQESNNPFGIEPIDFEYPNLLEDYKEAQDNGENL